MTSINIDLYHIPSLSSSKQTNLALPISQPIKIRGEINEQALINDMDKFFESVSLEALSIEAESVKIDSLGTDSLETGHSKAVHSNVDNNYKDFIQPQLFEQSLNNLEVNEFIHSINIGVDEVGRGPLYGSVVVSAVILPHQWSAELMVDTLKDTPLSILTDSKKLTELKREKLFEPIKQCALSYVTIEIPSVVIDQINILQATMLGMRLACETVLIKSAERLKAYCSELDDGQDNSIATSTFKKSIDFKVLIDGNKVPELDIALLNSHDIGDNKAFRLTSEAWVKGDARHTAIAAASVLAKVTRDRQVIEDSTKYAGYGLEGHKGYPTKLHLEAINRLGVLPQHRRSFRPIQQAILNGTLERHD